MVTKYAGSYCDIPMQKSALPGQSVIWEWAQKPHGPPQRPKKRGPKANDLLTQHYSDGVELAPFSVTMMYDLVPMLEGKASGVAVRSPEPMKSYAMSPPPAAGKSMMKTITAPEKEMSRKDEIVIDKKTTPRSPGTPNSQAGLLTAREWNDLDNWATYWADLLTDGEINAPQTTYDFFPRHRYTVLLTNTNDFDGLSPNSNLLPQSGGQLCDA
jgi:hypothetical protein